MNIVYLINTKDHNYHRALANDFTLVTKGSVFDMADGTDPGSRYYEIENLHPDVIITFDLAGHVLRTGSDTLSLNNIYTRAAHILFHKTDHYGRDLSPRQNLSMFTYIPEGEDIDAVRLRYPEVPNIEHFVSFSYKPADEAQHESNIAGIRHWWDDFQKEAML